MKWLKAIFLEVFGLFSDDGHFTVAILVWLALLWLLLPRLHLSGVYCAVILFVGLIVILIESVLRQARVSAR